MKKIAAILISLLIMLAMTACDDTEDMEIPIENTAENIVNETKMHAAIDDDGEETNDDEKYENEYGIRQDAFIEETLLYDENDVMITVVGLSYGYWDADLEFLLENNSDKDLHFSSGSIFYDRNSVNDYMISTGYLGCNVPAGENETDSLRIDYDELALHGIYEISEITVYFEIMNDSFDSIYTEPLQVKTSAYDSHDRNEDTYLKTISDDKKVSSLGYESEYFSDDVLYEKNGIMILSEAMLKYEDKKGFFLLEVENNSENAVFIGADNISANGLVLEDGFESSILDAGKRCVLKFIYSNIMDDNLWEVYGIKEIDTVGFDFQVWNEDRTEMLDSEEMLVKVSDSDSGFDDSGEEVYSKNGFRIISKKAVMDSYEYSIYICLLVENNSTDDIYAASNYRSILINGHTADMSYISAAVPAGRSTAVVIRLWDLSMDETEISSADYIENYELTLMLKNGQTRETIDEAAIAVRFDK